MAQSPVEVGVIGAGITYHLLKTSRRLGRDVHVTIYDKNSSAGGTWSVARTKDHCLALIDRSKDCVYPGLMTNNSWTQMLFDDDEHSGRDVFESDRSTGAGPGGFRATGQGMIQVMERVEKQVLGLGATILYGTEVVHVQREGTWVVESVSAAGPLTRTFDKLVVATGAFSRPAVPPFALPLLHPQRTPVAPEQQTAPLAIHTSHLSEPSVQASLTGRPRRFVVVGASKSALDASERFATLGHDVTLVLRNPPYLAPPALSTPAGPADAVAMVGTRERAIGVPYPADPVSGKAASGGWWASLYRRLVHSSWLSGYLHPGIIAKSVAGFSRWGQWANPAMAALVPKVMLMWSESSIFPGPETLAQLVQSGRIKLVSGGVTSMDKTEDGFTLTVRGKNDEVTSLACDTVIFGSGWSTGEYPFFDGEMLDTLGLPVPYTKASPAREAHFAEEDKRRLRGVLSRLRTMRLTPAEWSLAGFSARFGAAGAPTFAPYRLYRLMVPLDSLYDRDIAFAGIPTCKANHVLFICQAHWITDYLLDLLPRMPSRAQAVKEISTQTVWAQRLFGPSHGRLGQWLGAMWIEYCSRLCWDMGVADDEQGWNGVITSETYNLERKRQTRDERA